MVGVTIKGKLALDPVSLDLSGSVIPLAKSGTHRLYVDCEVFPDVENTECL